MDAETARAVAVMNYLTTIISCYFSPVEPQVMAVPPTENEEDVLTLIGNQFKAFMELGIPINHRKFSQFFKLAKSPSLFSEKPILNSDDQIRMFVAMEGSFKHPQELVAIVVRGLKLVTIRHMIGSKKSLLMRKNWI